MHTKSFLASLAIVPSLLIFASPAHADCPYFNFWKTSDGRCIDLTYIGYQAPAQGDYVDESRSTVVTDLTIQGGVVVGTLQNVSDRTIRISRLRYQLTHMGTAVSSGTFEVNAILEPGQTLQINDDIPAAQQPRIRNLPGVRVRMIDILYAML